MPYDASNIDHVCTDCGKVVNGPHTGEHLERPQGQTSYKGAGLSHTQCEDCQRSSENERMMVERHGPNWREKGQKAKAHLDAEQVASKHWWWRKL